MKTFRLIAISFVFAAIFAVSSFAQTPTTPASGKIGLVNTEAFGAEKGGITKFTTAFKTLTTEFKPDEDAINGMRTNYQTKKKEIEGFQEILNKGGKIPISDAEVQKKVDDLGKLERDIKFKQEDAKARYERRYQSLMSPIWNDIRKAMQDYAKAKGYAVILDGVKLEQADILLGFDEKYDVTTDFITFFNARPAGTAATTPTK